MPDNPPTYVLVAKDGDDKDMQIAKLKAALEASVAEAKKANEDKEKMEATLKAANVFNQGNGVNNVNTIAQTQNEPATKVIEAQTAKIKEMSQIIAKPMIEQILTARKNLGDDESRIKEEEKRLTAMTYDEISKEFTTNQIFINQALQGSTGNIEALFAKQQEKDMPFNGISNNALVGKTYSLDNILNEVVLAK